jgi:hypothetical protein
MVETHIKSIFCCCYSLTMLCIPVGEDDYVVEIDNECIKYNTDFQLFLVVTDTSVNLNVELLTRCLLIDFSNSPQSLGRHFLETIFKKENSKGSNDLIWACSKKVGHHWFSQVQIILTSRFFLLSFLLQRI